jgi:CheY-like chemotaxis protein
VSRPIKKLNILLVEDDELDVLNVQRAFRGTPTIDTITVAGDGVEGLRLLRSGEISTQRLLVMLDLRMPRMSGLEFLHHLRQDPGLNILPVVVMTTSRDVQDLREAYRHHVAGYLFKPVSLNQFRDCMNRFQAYWSQVSFPWESDVH